jgi:hypothetical protein
MTDDFSLNKEQLDNLVKLLKDKKLLTNEKEPKLDLKIFNRNLETASKNLGIVIPSIVDVSKEQVKVINNGLEGTINFIRTFQTFNTAFAVFSELGNDVKNEFKSYITQKMGALESLENYIIDEVGRNLENLDNMLTETFQEVAVYYRALGEIIYSEEEQESGKTTSYTGKRRDSKGNVVKEIKVEFTKSLGLVQLIESLVQVNKEIKTVKIDKTSSVDKYYIQGEKGKIEVNMSIISSLQDISGSLLNSLDKAGVLIKDEHSQVLKIKSEGNELIFQSKAGKNALNKLKNKLKEHSRVSTFLIRNGNDLDKLKNLNIKDKDKVRMQEDINKLEKEKQGAINAHDQIIKNQMNLIVEVVNSFASIVSLWGHQVDNEISISQVADKAVIAIDKLSQVQIKSGLDTEELLVAKKTQEEISKTCKKAVELKHVGKVMQYLLERIKLLIKNNKGLESAIRTMYKQSSQAKEYKREQLKKIKKVLYESYPKVNKGVANTIKEFNDKIKYLTIKGNEQSNMTFIDDLIEKYSDINKSLIYTVSEIHNEIEKITPPSGDISNFETSCNRLGIIMDKPDNKMDKVYDSLKKFNSIFSDDFKVYKQLNENYKQLVKGMAPMLDIMEYVSGAQKKLVNQEIDLKAMNFALKGFLILFKEVKKNQIEQKNIDEGLKRVMKEVGIDRNDFYEEYKKKMKNQGLDVDLLKKLETLVNNYFDKHKEELKKGYSQAKIWTKEFSFKFSEYNKELKSMNVGFFAKLFKTQSYKENDFFGELNKIEKSFSIIDNQIIKISKLNLTKGRGVKGFCKTSVTFVNEMLKGYNDLIDELTKVVEVMNLVNQNLKRLDNTKIEKFKKFLEFIEKHNNKLDDIEQEIDFEELEKFNTSNIVTEIKELTDFEEISKKTQQKLEKLQKIKPVVKKTVQDFKNYLLLFYTTYLTQVNLSEKDKNKYTEIYKEAKSNIK